MSHKVNIVKSFLLRWIILHGDNWVFHSDAYEDDFIAFDIARGKKYFEEEKEQDFLHYGSCHKNLYLLLLEDL